MATGPAASPKKWKRAHPPAARGLAQPQQRIQLRAGNALVVFARIRLVDQAALLHNIGEPVGHPRIRRQSVAPRAACLLVIALDAFRQVEVGDEPHVGLVDPHAEGDGRHHDDGLLALEACLVLGARGSRHASMVGQRGKALRREPGGGLVDLAPRQAVHDAGLARVLLADERQQLRARVHLIYDRITDIGSIEARYEYARVFEPEAGDDLAASLRVGGRGERNARHLRETLVQDRQLQILGTEIMAPLRHAMRLVDREQRDAAAPEQLEASWRKQTLGCHVEQVELTRGERPLYLARARRVQARVAERGAHAELPEGRDLVLHQGDQRRDHDPCAGAKQRRHLIAK